MKLKERLLKTSVLILLIISIGTGVHFYADWYYSLPVVKYYPDGEIAAVEIKGEYHELSLIEEVGERYIKKWVSYEWKPPE